MSGFSRLLSICAALLVTWAALLSTSFTPTAHAQEQSDAGGDSVVVIMTSGLEWTRFSAEGTPNLARLAADGTMANLVPLATRGGSCPVDSWLTISAGRQISSQSVALAATTDPIVPESGSEATVAHCPEPAAAASTRLRNWSVYQEAISNASTSATLGTLAGVLGESGVTTQAIGTGAGYVMVNSDGSVPDTYISAPSDDDALAALVSESATRSQLTVVDADKDTYSSDPVEQSLKSMTVPYVNAARIEAILEQLHSGTRVVVASLTTVGTSSAMQLAVVGDIGSDSNSSNSARPGISTGLAVSDSVRQEGVIQVPDLAPTLLSWLGVDPPATMQGSVLRSADVEGTGASVCEPNSVCFTERLTSLTDQAEHSGHMRALRGQFFQFMTWSSIGFFLISLVLLVQPVWLRLQSHLWLAKGWSWFGMTIASLPLTSLVVNMLRWWDTGSPRVALIGGAWLLAGGVAVIGLNIRRIHPAAPLVLISALTSTALIIDTATGSRFMADSPIGFNLLTAARFYGVGNEAYAVIGAGSLMALAFLGMWIRDHGGQTALKKYCAVAVVGILGLCVAAIDAMPSLGADFGGALSYLPALLVLIFLIAKVRISVPRLLGIGAVTVVGAAAIAVADWMRPAQARTHLGRFVQSIVDGDLWDVLIRKIETNLRLLVGSTHRWVVLAALLLLILALLQALRSVPAVDAAGAAIDKKWRPTWWNRVRMLVVGTWGWLGPRPGEPTAPLTQRMPALRAGLISVAVCMALAFLLNDSGIVLPGMAAILIVPLLVSLVLRDVVLRSDAENPAEADAN